MRRRGRESSESSSDTSDTSSIDSSDLSSTTVSSVSASHSPVAAAAKGKAPPASPLKRKLPVVQKRESQVAVPIRPLTQAAAPPPKGAVASKKMPALVGPGVVPRPAQPSTPSIPTTTNRTESTNPQQGQQPSTETPPSQATAGGEIQYKRLGSTPYVVPPNVRLTQIFSHLATLPADQHKGIHHLNESIQLFFSTLRKDYAEQKAVAKGKPLTRFTWKNQGALAEHFAIACDQMKKVGSILTPKEKFPLKDFSAAFLSYLESQSQVPTELVGMSKYQVKLKDWEKGGTRYATEHGEHVSNVKFAGVSEREAKLIQWIKEKSCAPASSQRIAVKAPVGGDEAGQAVVAAAPTVSAAPPPDTRLTRLRKKFSETFQQVLVTASSMAQAAPADEPPETTVVSTYPTCHLSRMKEYVSLCNTVGADGSDSGRRQNRSSSSSSLDSCPFDSGFCIQLLDFVSKSSDVAIQREFEKQQGLVCAVGWVARVLENERAKEHLYRLLESILNFQCSFGEATRKAWLLTERPTRPRTPTPPPQPPTGATSAGTTSAAENAKSAIAEVKKEKERAGVSSGDGEKGEAKGEPSLQWMLGAAADAYLRSVVKKLEAKFSILPFSKGAVRLADHAKARRPLKLSEWEAMQNSDEYEFIIHVDPLVSDPASLVHCAPRRRRPPTKLIHGALQEADSSSVTDLLQHELYAIPLKTTPIHCGSCCGPSSSSSDGDVDSSDAAYSIWDVLPANTPKL